MGPLSWLDWNLFGVHVCGVARAAGSWVLQVHIFNDMDPLTRLSNAGNKHGPASDRGHTGNFIWISNELFSVSEIFFPDTTSFGKKPKKGPKFFESKDQVSDRWMSIIEKKIVFFFWGALLDTRLFGTCDFVLRLNVVWQNVVWLIVIQPSHPSNKALNT